MAQNTDQSSRISGTPGRTALSFATLAYAALAIYGSLVPLRYEPIAWADAVARFRDIPYFTLGPGSRADWVSNILLFVPLTFLCLGALTVDRQSRVGRIIAAVGVVLAGTLLSVALEFTQLWFPTRTVSQNDIIAETIGAVAGVVIWLVVGQAAVEWVRRYTRAARGRQQFDWLLELYFVGFVLYSLLPLDLTISSGELWGKFKDGKVNIVPFADVTASWLDLYGLMRDIAVFIPVGILVATWRIPRAAAVRPIGVTALVSGLIAAAIEAAQLLVLSRFTSSTDILLGTLGASIGGVSIARWHAGGRPDAAAVSPSARTRRAWMWVGAAIAWGAVIAAIACAPFEVSGNGELWREQYHGFWTVPFASLYHESEYNAVSEVLRKTILFGVFAALCTRAILALALPPIIRRLFLVVVVLIAAGLAGAIELAQVFLPPHVPDITDVILAAVGAIFGVMIVMRLAGRATVSSAPALRARR